MRMTTAQISYERFQQLVKEELTKLRETVDHKGINGIVSVASKLLAAVEAFKEKAPPAAVNAVTPHMGELEKTLENMVSTPGSYVAVIKKEPQRVSLKAVKKEGASFAENEALLDRVDASRMSQEEWARLSVLAADQAGADKRTIDRIATMLGIVF